MAAPDLASGPAVALAAGAPADGAVDQQDDDLAPTIEGDEPGIVARRVEVEELAQISRDDGAADADQRSHDEPAGIAPRHKELGDQPDDGADNDGPR